MDRSSLIVSKCQIESIIESISLTNKDISICARCILRYCNVKQVFNQCTHQEIVTDLIWLLGLADTTIFMHTVNGFCCCCLNLLSDSFIEDKSKQIQTQLNEYRKLQNSLKHFQLQIHLPVVLTLRDKFYSKMFHIANSEILNIKEVFKILIASRLGSLLRLQHQSDSNFIIGNSFNLNCM